MSENTERLLSCNFSSLIKEMGCVVVAHKGYFIGGINEHVLKYTILNYNSSIYFHQAYLQSSRARSSLKLEPK